MSFVYWLPNADGYWNSPSNWSGGALPGSGDNVTISTSTLHTIIHSSGNDTIASLAVGNDVFEMAAGGSLDVTGAISMASGYIQTGGSLFAGGTVSVTGTAQLLGGVLGEQAVFEAAGLITLSNYTLSGSAQLINTGTVNETGNLALSTGSASLLNEAGAVYDITAGNVAISNGSTPVSSFSNAGTLEMTATGTVTSHVYVDLASTGVLTATSGSNLEIDGPSNTVTGTITGTGQISFGGGTTTIASGTVINAAMLGVYGNSTSVTFAGAQTLGGGLSLGNASTLALGGNTTVAGGFSDVGPADILLGSHTLTLQGTAQFGYSGGVPIIAGTGRLVTSGTTTILSNGGAALTLGGSVAWYNAGTINQGQTIQLGTASGSAASLVNQAGGVFDVTAGGIAVTNGSAPVSKFSNAGTLEMTATGTTTSRVYADLASTALITTTAGNTLELDGPVNTLSGTIAGAGEVSLGAGTTTIAQNINLGVATLGIYGTGTNVTFAGPETLAGSLAISGSSTLTVNGNTSIAGGLSQTGASDILIGNKTLTIQGNAFFEQSSGSPLIAGTGRLITRGTTTLANNNGTSLILGGSAQWDNYGTVNQNQSLQIGTPSGAAATVVNEAAGVFDIAVSGIVIGNGSAPVSTFSSAGTLEMTATNNGTSFVQADLVSTGVISAVASSNLEIDGPANRLAGTITGIGQVGLGAGTTTIAGSTTINAGTLSIYNGGTDLALGGNNTVSGGFSMGWASDLLLAGNTLTLAGNASFYEDHGTPVISGPGELLTQGTTTVGNDSGPALTVGSGVTWENTGLVTQNQSFQVGNSTSQSASLLNDAGAVFDLAGYVAVNNGSTPTSTFVNAGTLEMTGTNTTGYVRLDLTSTGVLSAIVDSNLELDGPSNSLSGTITGAGQIFLGSGTTTIAGSTTITAANLEVYNTGTALTFGGAETIGGNLTLAANSAIVTLGGNTVVDGSYAQYYGSTLSLGAYTLTLDGNALFQNGNTPTVTGTGTLATLGTTTLVNTAALVLGGSATWSNSGTVVQDGSFQVGNTSTATTLVNQTSGVFDLAGYVAVNNGSTPASIFSNAGTLEMTGVNTTGYVRTNLLSTGVISSVAGSNLEIDGPANTISGTVTGTGQVSFGAGTTMITGGTSISGGTLALYNDGTDVVLSGDETVTSVFSMGDGSSLSLAGHTLTLTSTASFYEGQSETPVFDGPGTLLTEGTTNLTQSSYALAIVSGVTWENAGTVIASQDLQLGTDTLTAATLLNVSGAVFDIASNRVTISNNSAPVSTFSNAGTLEMTATNNQISFLQADLLSTGVISSVAGSNLEIDGPANSISGTITGTGQVSFGAGTMTIAGGTSINVGTLALYNDGTDVVLGGDETVTSAFSMGDGSSLSLAGHTLTLTGTASFYEGQSETPVFDGPGTLVTEGMTNLTQSSYALAIVSGVTWKNAGTVVVSQDLQLGTDTLTAATLLNVAGAVFDIASNRVTISNNSAPASIFSNSGTLEMTATNNQISFLQADLLSTGVISSVAGSNLEIDGPANTISGTIAGTGQVSFGAGTTTIAGTTAVSVGTLALYNAGTTLKPVGNLIVSGSFADSNATTLALSGHTVTFSGAATFNQNSGTPTVTGTGTLVTRGATSLGGGGTAMVLGGTATWNNFGTVTESRGVQIGDSTNGTATVNNEKGGVFDIVSSGVTLSNGGTLASIFSNTGLLEMTAIGGSAGVAANVTNTGTVLAQGGSLALGGAVTGTGLLDIQSNGALGFSGTVQSTQTAKFLDTTGRLNITLPSANAFAAEIAGFVAGDTIDLTNISNATGTFSAGVLTFADNTSHAVVATLNFANTPTFTFGSDGHGGTLISATSHNARGPGPVPQAMQFIGPQVATETPTFPDLAGETSVSAIFDHMPDAEQAGGAASHLSGDRISKPALDAYAMGLHPGHAEGPEIALSWYASAGHYL